MYINDTNWNAPNFENHFDMAMKYKLSPLNELMKSFVASHCRNTTFSSPWLMRISALAPNSPNPRLQNIGWMAFSHTARWCSRPKVLPSKTAWCLLSNAFGTWHSNCSTSTKLDRNHFTHVVCLSCTGLQSRGCGFWQFFSKHQLGKNTKLSKTIQLASTCFYLMNSCGRSCRHHVVWWWQLFRNHGKRN